ncbi:MAG TPA: hypothetical protein ENH28_01620 [Euryarchaeota archaeon]|nr:hypothetical protein [Euryarchaeota archaeon]
MNKMRWGLICNMAEKIIWRYGDIFIHFQYLVEDKERYILCDREGKTVATLSKNRHKIIWNLAEDDWEIIYIPKLCSDEIKIGITSKKNNKIRKEYNDTNNMNWVLQNDERIIIAMFNDRKKLIEYASRIAKEYVNNNHLGQSIRITIYSKHDHPLVRHLYFYKE